mmetsp:Transcript_6214/g.6377  ORF Transcript_6214/g.6377 Transcript_6214/m.6377 type:complete len:325 (+) Transcript_6214:37-1011(+)|eukprot:CAMPEP_0119037328 /NCGR_PEP_ID=MMETSP1177-20130426/5627_1 /TAXON_ID=2985 /ORGANISM="Ochromonas sp, Strain CCMP1899" /LENGTH=324 /DNA_ID=CAMNT_0006998461 /DNA_START=23 /DNA_END=997 /DNA_ORIENTATION=+
MSAATGSFSLEILDSNIDSILKHTIIGNRTYVSAIEGKEFAVRVTVHNPTRFISNGDDELIIDYYFNGFNSNSRCLASRTSLVVASVTLKSLRTTHGEKAMVFDAPVVIPFFDMDDAKDNVETNKDSITGTISVKISSSRRSNAASEFIKGIELTGNNVKDTKKFFQRPNIGISTGRVLAKNNEGQKAYTTIRRVLVAELKVWCQPDGIVSLFERLEREKDNDDIQQPVDSNVDSNDDVLQPCKIEKRVIADTNQLLDLTDDSSSHSSKKQARQDSSSSSGSSSGSNGGNSLPIDLTAEASIEPVVKKELIRLSKGAIHLDLTL